MRTPKEAREDRRNNHRDSARERRRLEARIIEREIGLDLSIVDAERNLRPDILAGFQSDASVRNADRLSVMEMAMATELELDDDSSTWVELLSGEHLDEVSEYYGGTGFRELKLA